MREAMARLGHFVVVLGLREGVVEILDPATPGTAYDMTLSDFLIYWNYQAVYAPRPQ